MALLDELDVFKIELVTVEEPEIDATLVLDIEKDGDDEIEKLTIAL